MAIAIAAALGLVAGAVAAFVASLVGLALKRRRNGRLAASGEPAVRDVAMSRSLVPLGALVAAPLSAVLAIWLPLPPAVGLGAAAPAVLIVAATLIASCRPGG